MERVTCIPPAKQEPKIPLEIREVVNVLPQSLRGAVALALSMPEIRKAVNVLPQSLRGAVASVLMVKAATVNKP